MQFHLRRTLLALSLAAAIPAAHAAPEAGQFYVGPSAQFYKWDSDSNIKEGDAYTLDFGYQVSKNIALQYSYGYGKTELDEGLSNDVHTRLNRLEGIYNFNPDGEYQPYAIVGAGQLKTKVEAFGHQRATYLDAGVGVQRFVTENLAVGAEARYNFNDNDNTHDASYGLTAHYYFGGSPKAAQPAPVVAAGPGDSDVDGVYDNLDQCPGTPAGVSVDSVGCPKETIKENVSIEMKVLFDYDKSVVKPEFYAEVEKVAKFLKDHTDTDATIEGHTDSRGTDAYNQALSERRAQAVRELLVTQFGIAESRLKSVGYGEARPVADNKSDAGRAQNRRVISVIVTQVEKAAN